MRFANRTDSAKLPEILSTVCPWRAHDIHNPGCLPSMGNRWLGFPLRYLAVAATLPSRLGGMTLVRSPRFRRRFHAAVWPRFARSPATQTRPSFWKGKSLRFTGSQRRPSASATHLRRASTPDERFALAREWDLWRPFAFAVAVREISQTHRQRAAYVLAER